MFNTRHLVSLIFSLLATMLLTSLLRADDTETSERADSGTATSSSEAAKNASAGDVGSATADSAAAESSSSENTALETVADRVPDTDNVPVKSDVAQSDMIAALQAGPKALSLAFRVAAKRATPSVVVLYAYGQGEDNDSQEKKPDEDPEDELPLLERAEIPTPPPAEEKLTGIGSGVIVSQDGLIITNNHVITGAKKVVVQLPDETRLDADFFRGDPDSDVGVLRVSTSEKLPAVEVGDSDRLEIGDWVLAIGSPFKLEATVSAGIISGKNRQIERIKRGSMLQTDAAINPGNSGGALIDLDGKVIGISTAIATRTGFYQGVGFAIPINQARWIADELDQHGEVRRAAIGTTLADLKPRIAKKFKLEPYSGILVYQIIKDSVAEKAGLKPYDVIVEFAGQPIPDSASLQEVIERLPIGSMQPIVVKRKGKRLELTVKLATVDDPTGGE